MLRKGILDVTLLFNWLIETLYKLLLKSFRLGLVNIQINFTPFTEPPLYVTTAEQCFHETLVNNFTSLLIYEN